MKEKLQLYHLALNSYKFNSIQQKTDINVKNLHVC